MLMAARDPGRIVGTVMNDIGSEVNPAGLERIGSYVGQARSFPTWIHAARGLQEAHSVAFPDFDLEQWLVMAKRSMVLGQNGRVSLDYDMAIAEPFKQSDNAAPPNLWPAFEALGGAPLTLLRGELSDLLSEATLAKMKERHPEMQTVTVPRVGHAPTLDEPESRAAIDALLAQLG